MAIKRWQFETRAEWLEFRKQGVGCSEIAAILGMSKFQTAGDVWRSKIGSSGGGAEGRLLKFGNALEPVIADEWADETGHSFCNNGDGYVIYTNDKYPYLYYSPDKSFRRKGSEALEFLEVKFTTNTVNEDELPESWVLQMNTGAGITESPTSNLAYASYGGRNFGSMTYDFDTELFDITAREVEEWWCKYVLAAVCPPPQNTDDLKSIHPSNKYADAVEADSELKAIFDALIEVKAQRDKYEALCGEYEFKIKQAIGDNSALAYDGRILCTWTQNKASEKFDHKSFRRDFPEETKAYMSVVPGARVLRIKKSS
jgi:predicted phage-related endonuclease